LGIRVTGALLVFIANTATKDNIKMKNNIITQATCFLAFTCPLLLTASCKKFNGDGPVVSETRTLSNYKSISSSVDANIIYTQSAHYSIEITAQQNVINKIRSEVSGDELRFYYPGNTHFINHEPINIYISAPHVNDFTIDGSGELRAGALNLPDEDVHLKINGSGSVYFTAIKAGVVDADIFGSGDMRISDGTAGKVYTEIKGSGNMDLSNLMSKDVYTNTSGSGDTRVWATNNLNVDISGSGDVHYRGTPRVSTNISGSGKVQPQ
jgi:hypothetical protein